MAIVQAFIIPACISRTEAAPQTITYSSWAHSLAKYVAEDGMVNYGAWKNSRQDLDSFIGSFEKITSNDYQDMSRDDRLALWINAYNAFTVKLILDHYPIKRSGFNMYPSNSIRQIDGVWTKYRIKIAGRNVTLSDIENKILRTEFKEPLIHFAINCASISCPKLSTEPYIGSKIHVQLKQSARRFVNDQSRNRFDLSRRRVELSSIFQWYKDDFVAVITGKKPLSGRSLSETSVLKLIEGLVDGGARKMLASNDFKISYLPYNWSLNERKTSHEH